MAKKNEKLKPTKAQSSKSAEFERERITSLINSMADAVIATDPKANILLYNGAALNIFDTNQDLTGKSLTNICKIVDKNNQNVDISSLISSVKTQITSRDYRIIYPDKSNINLYVSIAPVRLGYGKNNNQGYVMLFRDITREKSLEEERDEFISVVSHELRTPIAIAEGEVGNAEFLAKKLGGNPQINEALKQAHEQILFLSNMINDLATLSRAERGKLNVEVESVNCHELIKGLEVDYQPEAKKKGLELNVVLDPYLEVLKSSKLYVREILQNFITNAIKYTEKGSVTISAKPYDKGVLFEVGDTGIGISKGDQEKVFDKFFRSEDFRTRATNGTGLGLYVTMKLAHLINAEIELKSEIDKGSVFLVKVPNLN